MKINRQREYDKLKGHCGYCGREIAYKDMQLDHMIPLCNGGENSIDNILPTCRQCNHYKRGSNVEQFRKSLTTIHERLAKIYINKVAVNFGISIITPFDGQFYFEKINQPEETGK